MPHTKTQGTQRRKLGVFVSLGESLKGRITGQGTGVPAAQPEPGKRNRPFLGNVAFIQTLSCGSSPERSSTSSLSSPMECFVRGRISTMKRRTCTSACRTWRWSARWSPTPPPLVTAFLRGSEGMLHTRSPGPMSRGFRLVQARARVRSHLPCLTNSSTSRIRAGRFGRVKLISGAGMR